MKKFLCVLSVLSALVAFSTMCFAGEPSQGSASDEPVYYDGVNNKLGTSSNPFFFANGTPITISESGDGTVITWADGSVEVANNTNVFGGYHDDDTAIETSIVMNGGTVNAILGGGLHKSHVTKASVKINKGTINYQVCGGGASSLTRSCGCENGSTWYAGDSEKSPCRVDEVELIVEDGAIFKGAGYSLLYGGGEGISYTGTTNLTINGGSFSDTYVTATGSNGYTGSANLTISGGDFGTIVQGVNRGEADEVTIKISGGNFNEVYAGGETADSSVSATYNTAKITVEGDAVIKKLLPGSNGKSTTDDATNVSLKVGKDATIKNITNKDEAFDLFGDNAEIEALKNVPFYYDGTTRKLGKETRPFFFANGTPITISEGENGTVITWADGSVEVANNTNVFGGYHDDDTAIETSVVMNGGTVNAIFGGGLHKSHVTKASVKINKGTINYQVCGGGASSFTKLCGCENGSTWYAGDSEKSPCRVDNAELTVEDGAVFKGAGYSLLYGGGEGISYTGTTNLTINGGSFSDTYVTATGSNGYTGNANLTINSGDFGTVVQGVNRGEADKVTIKINGGTFNEVYAGGETADSSVSATYNSVKITVDGNAVIEKLLPGSNGKSTTDDATNVSLKVGKTATIKNITDEKTAKEIFNENIEYKKDTKPTTGGGLSVVKYEIKVVTPENGGIYPNGKVRVKKGNEQKFTFVPDDGYEISKILVDGEEVDVFDFYIFKNVRSDHTIEVIFEKNTSDWAEKEIENAKKNGLVPTVLENKDLTLEITRLEFASACVKLYEKLTNKVATATKTDVFEDCNDTEVLKAFELGITNGVSETAFAPNSSITREQMATMLARTIALTGIDTTVYTKDIKFADESTISSWAKNSVRYMAQEELINGVGEGKFAPTGTATREQTLAISERTFEKFSK